MVTIKIDRDYISEPGEETRVGTEIETPYTEGYWTRFRCKDDDGIVYYGGKLINDDLCENQSVIFDWAMHDAGCTMVEVWIYEQWTQEIA